MINVGHDKHQVGTYKVWYDHDFPCDRESFTKDEAIDFAVRFHIKKQDELKAYNFSPRDVFLHCPESEVAEIQAEVNKRLKS